MTALARESNPFSSIDALIDHAIALRASDIHITPRPTGFCVQLRMHGLLDDPTEIPAETGRLLIQALKAESRMNIAETRRPQDARLSRHEVDLRLATHPSLHGENMVIRLLSRNSGRSLEELGLDSTAMAHLHQLLEHETGLLLVAGATGSGKTTTLHALLNQLGDRAGRIATLEDPVEIINPRAVQTDLSRLAHLDFASGLRSLMRQDPDTILVGEIRDEDTAELTLNAALTGHRVFASVHAPDCLGALCRLTELNISLGSLLNCLNGIATLRLKPAASGQGQVLQAEIMNLRSMPRRDVLACHRLEDLLQLCNDRSFQPFPGQAGCNR
ncbi:MAG TPA: ATPase, T2SS/T4P/T4SS family [Limnobacter sp.]|nr:ATPase, T2SS/T4P/T4SS family [Limnobacter sp.]